MALSQSEINEMRATLAGSRVPSQAETKRLQAQLDDAVPLPDRTLAESAALQGEAFARGAAQGATFGFADEIGGALGMADEFLSRQFGSGGQYAGKPLGEALSSRYVLEREASQREMEKLREEAPVATAAGETTGALAVPVPGAGAVGGLAVRGARAAGMAAKAEPIARVAAQSALGSALTGYGEGEGLGDALQSAVVGGATAGLTSKVATAASPFLKEFAETAALRAVGAKAGITNALQKMGYESAAEARQLGRMALDRKIVTAGATKDEVLARARNLKETAGQTIKDVTDLAERRGVVYDWIRAARKTAAPFLGLDEQSQRVAGPVRDLVEDILTQSGKQAPEKSFDAARRLKTAAQAVVTWDPATGSLPAKLKRKAVNAFTDDFRKQVKEQLGKKVGKKLKDASDAYGAAVDMEKLAMNAATGEAQQRVFGLIGTGLGAAAGLTAGITQDSAGLGLGTMAVVPLLESIARRRGPALSAVTADRVSKFMAKHGPKIQSALEGGQTAKATTHFLLSQRDPEYRRDAQELEEELRKAGINVSP